MKNILFAILCWVAFPVFSQTVPIITYHRVTDEFQPGDTVVSMSRFVEHLDMLKDNGYNTVTISDVVSFMRGEKTLPEKSIAITFDDGWKDQLLASKELADRKMSATFYITSGHFRHKEYMDEDEVYHLSKNPLFEIGAHSHTHYPDWLVSGKIPTSMMVGELTMSRFILQKIIKREIKHYAWPFGYATTESVQFAELLGFSSTAMINNSSKNKQNGRALELERINISGTCSSSVLTQMIDTGTLLECK